jgi:hypothetical protein
MTLDVRKLIAFRASVHRVDLPSGEALEAKTYESGGYGIVLGPRATQEQLEEYFGSEHSDAPPCIRKALKEGIPEGS